ncbi:MAG: hypothetical protein JWN90_383 [Parcubacteria group bacterium]|nr:hypothetical protein [Parcubacteria group bacterium]
MIHVYARIAGLIIFVLAVFLFKRAMFRIGVPAGRVTTICTLLYSLSMLFTALQVIALICPNEFWPYYGAFGFPIFAIAFLITVRSARSRTSAG